MDKSPLELQFDEADADHDGKIDKNEASELMKLLGKNVYPGSVQRAIKLINYTEPNTMHFTYPQFKQYYESYENEAKHSFWKTKYEVLENIFELTHKKQKHEEATAAPGMAGPVGNKKPEIPTEGDIQVTIGPQNQNFQNHIEFDLEKCPKEESKPFLKVVFEQGSVDQAKKLQTLIKALHTNIVELAKSESPEFNELTESINVITNVAGNRLNLFITTSNQMAIDLLQLFSEYLDRIFNSRITAHINLKYFFNADIASFLNQGSEYGFSHAFAKNNHLKLAWSCCNFKQGLKKILKQNQGLNDLKYDKTDIYSMVLISFLHTNLCDVKLSFDNGEVEGNEQMIKGEVLQGLKQMVNEISSIKDQVNLDILQLIAAINNNVNIQASVGDWRVKLNLNIKDLNLLFVKKQENNDDSDSD